MRVLGVRCAGDTAHWCLVEDGVALPECTEPRRAPELERGEALSVFLQDLTSDMRALNLDAVAIMGHESGGARPGLPVREASIAARAVIEALMLIAAHQAGVECAVVPPQTARSRLGFTGRLGDNVDKLTTAKTGAQPRWAHRGLAAMAALCIIEDT
jgi:hypothetical protein